MKVSLVVPVKNEADSIECLMSSVAEQTRRPNEMIIVDGGSEDGTPEIAEEWISRHSLSDWGRVVRVDDATPGKGRNIGVANANFSWIAFTDAGIRVERSWLERLIEVAERENQIDVVYGSYEPATETLFERCAALAYVAPKRLRAGQWMRGPVIPSSLIRREVWEGVGGFPDLRAAEDLMFMEAIERKGYKIAWAPQAVVWWRMPPTFRDAFRRFALYSIHNVRIGRQYDWHYGVLRQYVAYVILTILALAWSGWFWFGVVIGYGARVAKGIWARREGRGVLWAINPIQFTLVAAVLLTVDAAMFAGWWNAIRSGDRPSKNDKGFVQK
ncbi:MAG TPA: glycosyltransferase [Blastocatellia bacterium]|nr:glycosyltransferase [Blastocatellia bacterium]